MVSVNMTTATPVRLLVRPITADDNAAIAHVIREVSAEHGLTADKGYTVSDPNLDALFQLYSQPRSAYWVVEIDGQIAGGGGVAPLQGGEIDVCELQKMYFLPVLRGKGLAKRLAGTGVTVNAILPGPTFTEGLQEMLADATALSGLSPREQADEFVKTARPSSIIQRAADVDEVANLVVYLASPLSSATTGAALRVDGGVIDTLTM